MTPIENVLDDWVRVGFIPNDKIARELINLSSLYTKTPVIVATIVDNKDRLAVMAPKSIDPQRLLANFNRLRIQVKDHLQEPDLPDNYPMTKRTFYIIGDHIQHYEGPTTTVGEYKRRMNCSSVQCCDLNGRISRLPDTATINEMEKAGELTADQRLLIDRVRSGSGTPSLAIRNALYESRSQIRHH